MEIKETKSAFEELLLPQSIIILVELQNKVLPRRALPGLA